MPIQIQETTVRGQNVEILIADAPTKDNAKEWVNFSVSVSSLQREPLGGWRVSALQRLRDIIGDEIQKITSVRDHAS